MRNAAATVVRQRKWLVLFCLIIAALLVPFAPQTATKLEVGGAAVDRSEAAEVDALLASRFATPFSTTLVLVINGIPSLEETDGLDVLIEVAEEVTDISSVAAVLSYLDTVDPAFVGSNATFVIVGIAKDERRMDEVMLELRRATRLLESRLRLQYPGIGLAWTGAAAFDYDVRQTSTEDAAEAEQRVLPLTLVLLFLVFGSLVSALCPLIIAGFAVAMSLGAAVLISPYWHMTVLLQNIVTMIGLGIGIDYSLLMLSRFREERSLNPQPQLAATKALRKAGHTIVLSGGAVAIGFAALLFVPATELRSIATGGLLIVGFSVALATILLPALLTWLGPRVEAGRLWRPGKTLLRPKYWRAWGRWVVTHPLRVLVIFGLPLLAVAWQARDLSNDIPTGNWLPEHTGSARGAVALQRMGQSGLIQIIRVIVEVPGGQAADSEQGWGTVLSLGRQFAADKRVARVLSLPNALGVETVEQARKAIIQDELRDAYISVDRNLALIEIVPSEHASAGILMRFVRELRDTHAADDVAAGQLRLLVGGLPAHNADYQDAVGGSVVNIMLFIVLGSFVALLIGFRSFLGALKAIALNLLSVAAAMGMTVLVFQHGYGSAWFGVEQALDGLFPAVPIIVFCVVFGLSMDYEVFLLSRVGEGVRNGLSNDDAIVDGLVRTGPVITSAALVMIVVFAGFSLGDFLIIKILGFALAVAVLVDSTVIRLAVGPALIQLGGRWNWWPGIR